MFGWSRIFKTSTKILNNQSVRWKRKKPFWLGMAKSKIFVVREKKKIPHEFNELTRIKAEYLTSMRSLNYFIKNENPLLHELNTDTVEFASGKNLAEIIKESYDANEIWNNASAALREKRLKLASKLKSQLILSKISTLEEKKKECMRNVESLVIEEKEKSLTYITYENLEEAVDKCLNNIVNHNFAIDLDGNKY